MKRTILLLAAGSLLSLMSHAVNYTNEMLNYQIVFSWGMVWKHAGDATLSIKKTSTGYQAQLTGKTRSWADKVYPVRDTLKCTLNSKLQPLRYEKLTHEKDYYARDLVEYSYNYSHTSAKCTRFRKSGDTTTQLSAMCQAYDMLSVFYMLRDLDFAMLTASKPFTTVIFSGKEKEYLTIRYKGVEKVKMRDGSKREAHHVVFKFTQKGGKTSSDDLDAWLSTDEAHVPLLLQGALPVGKVKCYLAK
ncbi:MAG: DUF3108 domain-containing protein [Muribaculaceae bacterium]|nr:DUF3108 domain-containing protein [Muribaculaceae bacterium]